MSPVPWVLDDAGMMALPQSGCSLFRFPLQRTIFEVGARTRSIMHNYPTRPVYNPHFHPVRTNKLVTPASISIAISISIFPVTRTSTLDSSFFHAHRVQLPEPSRPSKHLVQTETLGLRVRFPNTTATVCVCVPQ
jgi:hypothetical protein